jgi:hypothetical protein
VQKCLAEAWERPAGRSTYGPAIGQLARYVDLEPIKNAGIPVLDLKGAGTGFIPSCCRERRKSIRRQPGFAAPPNRPNSTAELATLVRAAPTGWGLPDGDADRSAQWTRPASFSLPPISRCCCAIFGAKGLRGW